MENGFDFIDGIKHVKLYEKKYCQFQEEAIFDYIFSHILTINDFVLDLGAGGANAGLSNSRYLLDHKNWVGLLIDGDIVEDTYRKKHFITRENIVGLLKKYEWPTHFDLMSIDLDGNDYYILDEVLKNRYQPNVVICEFNATLAPDQCIAIEYNANHTWNNDNYYGASFQAFKKLMAKYDYTLVANIAQTNMIFIKNDFCEKRDYGIAYSQTIYHPINTTGKWITV